MNTTEVNTNPPAGGAEKNTGNCLHTGIFVVATILTLGISLGFLIIEWNLEQLLFDGELGLPDVRPQVAAGFGLANFILLALLAVLLRNSSQRKIYMAWMLAALPGLFSLPARFLSLSDAQGALAIILASLLIYIILLALLNRNRKDERREAVPGKKPGLLLASGLGALVMLPWVIWGALGSPLDIVLDLITGLVFGFAAAMTAGMIFDGLGQSADSQGKAVAGNRQKVIPVLVAFLILSAGITPVGLQPFLPPMVVLSTMLVVGLSSWQQGNGFSRGSLGLLIGLVAATTLLWVDGDELMLVINSDPGELFGYAFKMLTLSLVVLIVLGILAMLLQKQASSWNLAGAGPVAGSLAVWVVLFGLYFVAGQPGFYGEKLFVILKDQADLSALQNVTDAAERRTEVYQALVSNAQNTQADLLKALGNLHIQTTPFYLENAIEVNGGPLVRLWLTQQPEVAEILNSPHLRPVKNPLPVASGSLGKPTQTQWNLTLIHADQVWQQLNDRGSGIIVGQSDSGVDGNHPELADGYLGADGQNDYHWLDPWFGTTSPTDWNGHGTHTLGTILGNTVGVAPDAEWIGCVNLARNLGDPAYYLTCMQFMLAPYPQGGNALTDGDPSRGANVLNNSWGCPPVEGCTPDTFVPALQALKAAGVFVVASAGNSGYGGCDTVDQPIALNANVLSVGAVDAAGNLAGFSSVGPVTVDGSNRVKPEILAPGANVESSYPDDTYEAASGTSMSGPHLVGVVALMWSANPALIGQVDATTRIIEETAQSYSGPLPDCVVKGNPPENGVGYGIVDAYAAVQAALNYK